MKILTSYFANVKNLPKDILPVAICGKAITGWNYPEYKKLAPSYSILSEKKYQGGTEQRYTNRYNTEILGPLSANQVVKDLETLALGYNGVALICYEKPGDFCHRNLVAEWLKNAGYDVEEA